jgi:hypoxanthine phosphoribosyltransferase
MDDEGEVRERTGGREVRRIVYPAAKIAERVREMGREITEHYPLAEDLLIIGLLKGSFIFVGDLVREIARPLQVDFLVAASYGCGYTSSGEVRLLYDPEALRDRHVLS